jgi:flagellum-specific peptidoglycan hydrolase FlgJ
LRTFKNTNSYLFVFLLFFLFNSSYSQSRTEKIRAYIEKHKGLAVEQMAQFRIPASVILAQAIKESDFGTSELAKFTNNHFGIKCHSEWGGKNYLLDDDETDECFRAYNTIEESYYDHSMFLVSRPRYAFLFDYKISDHYNWCVGLKEAGYATAWNYTDELLLIIAVFHLDELDKAEHLETMLAYGELLSQPEKNIIEVKENYFNSAEKAILAKVIFNQAPAVEEPLLVRSTDPEHAD